MLIDDIDTPVSEAELSGIEVAEAEAEPVVETPKAEPVAEPAAVVEPEPVAAEPAQERAQVIPRARFDEVNAKLHAEREETERLRAELAASKQAPAAVAPVAEPVDFDTMERQYLDATMSGDIDQAVSIRAKINAEIRAQAKAEASEEAARQVSERDRQAAERESKVALQSVFSQAVADYPFLDTASPQVNADAIAEVVEWREFYMVKGDPIHVALKKAVAKVGPTYATAEPAAVAAAPVVDPRKQAAMVRNAADAMAQPPAQVAGVGNRAAPPKPKVESQKDWEKLTDAERDEILMGG